MNNPLLLLFLFTGIGIVIGMFAIAIAVIRTLKTSPDDTSAILLPSVVYIAALMSKPIYAFILTVVAQTQTNLIGSPLLIAGALFGLVAITQGCLGASFMRPTPSLSRTDAFSKLPLRLAVMGTIETIATMTMVFTIILTNTNAQ